MRDEIVAALSRRPGATMAELAEAAGISRATLHRRFPSRDSLVSHIAHDAAEAVGRAVAAAEPTAGPPGEACARLVTALVPLGSRFAFLLREGGWVEELPAVAAQTAALAASVDDLVERGRRAGAFRLDLPASFQSRLVVGVVFTAWEAVEAGEVGSREAPRAAVTALLAGIGAGG